MATVRPSDLPASAGVTNTDALVVDNGGSVKKATPVQVVDAAIPLASQAEAEAGTDNAKRVTPLRVKQAIAALGANTAAQISTSFGYDAQRRFGEVVSIMEAFSPSDYDAILGGTDTADRTAEVQALVDRVEAAGGGTITAPLTLLIHLNLLKLRSGVWIVGAPFRGTPSFVNPGLPTFKAVTGATAIITNDGTINGCGVSGIYFEGNGVGHGEKGITGTWSRDGFITNCLFQYFGLSAIQISPGATLLEDNTALNCLLDYSTLVAKTGVLDITGSDNWVRGGEYTASSVGAIGIGTTTAAVTSTNLYVCAVAIHAGSGNNWLLNVVAEISDVGYYIAGSNTKLIGCRGDVNAGYGFEIESSAAYNQLTACHGYRNGLGADNTYPHVKDHGAFTRITACTFNGEAGDARLPSNAVHNVLTFSTQPCTYAENLADQIHGPTYLTDTVGATHIRVLSGAALALSGGTPSVDNYDRFVWNGSGTITDFTNPVEGQEISFLYLGSATTITHSANLITVDNADLTPVSNMTYRFIRHNGKWYEQARPNNTVILTGSETYDPPSLTTGTGATSTFIVGGAALGDYVQASFSNDLQGIVLTGYVTSPGFVAVRFQNGTGGTIDLASGTVKVRVTKQ